MDNGEPANEAGVYTTTFMVPQRLRQEDTLQPLQFKVFDKNFYFLGRYNEGKDCAEFVLAGPVGTGYKLSLSDGNSPYGWKVKKMGMTSTNPSNLDLIEQAFDRARDADLAGEAQKSEHEERGKVQEMAFENEDLISVPHALMRSAGRLGIMDAKHECVRPWGFYGPSLPEYFCRCVLKVIVYDDEDVQLHGQGAVSPEKDWFAWQPASGEEDKSEESKGSCISENGYPTFSISSGENDGDEILPHPESDPEDKMNKDDEEINDEDDADIPNDEIDVGKQEENEMNGNKIGTGWFGWRRMSQNLNSEGKKSAKTQTGWFRRSEGADKQEQETDKGRMAGSYFNFPPPPSEES